MAVRARVVLVVEQVRVRAALLPAVQRAVAVAPRVASPVDRAPGQMALREMVQALGPVVALPVVLAADRAVQPTVPAVDLVRDQALVRRVADQAIVPVRVPAVGLALVPAAGQVAARVPVPAELPGRAPAVVLAADQAAVPVVVDREVEDPAVDRVEGQATDLATAQVVLALDLVGSLLQAPDRLEVPLVQEASYKMQPELLLPPMLGQQTGHGPQVTSVAGPGKERSILLVFGFLSYS